MIKREYKFCFYLNARHRMQFSGGESKIHPHTWEIVIHLIKNSDEFVRFTDIEAQIQCCLMQYEDKLLNDMNEFRNHEPSTENMGEVLYYRISELLDISQWSLVSFEISENPNRTYIISSTVHQNHKSINDSNKYFSKSPVQETAGDTAVVSDKNEAAAAHQILEAIPVQEPEKTEHIQVNELQTIEGIQFKKKNSYEKIKAIINRLNFPWVQKISRIVTRNNFSKIAFSTIVLLLTGVLTIFLLTRDGIYPWGTDLYGHLYKGHFLYEEFIKGNIFPLYTDDWYNGIQLFRYWPPLTYYFFLLMELLTKGNIVFSYYGLVLLVFMAGGFAWILWGSVTGRYKLGLAAALLWFFIPDNVRVLFAEGNLPRVIITNMFPYLLLAIWQYFRTRRRKYIVFIFVLTCFITFAHAMISAMVGLTLFTYSFWYGSLNGKRREAFEITAAALLGIALSGIWLYPAFKGGMLSMDKEAVAQISNSLTFPVTQSLNPFYTTVQADAFYFGLSVFIICVCGFIYAPVRSKAGFGVALVVFLGTTKALLPITSKLPMSQLFWMMRFVPLALACFLTGLFLWENLRKRVLVLFILLIVFDCINPMKALFYTTAKPKFSDELKVTTGTASHRVAMIDLSCYGSYPSYYITYNDENKNLNQTFGWAWQGAKTGSNIVGLNTAIEKGWYDYFFDRSLELGIDTMLVKKDEIKDMNSFLEKAEKYDFSRIYESGGSMILNMPVTSEFGSKVKYDGLGIGKYASNIAYIFPKFQMGSSFYIDDYTEEQLTEYKAVYIAGFSYRDKKKAEDIIKGIAEKGVKVIVDLTNAEVNLYTSRTEFLGVAAQPMRFLGDYSEIFINDKSMKFKNFPEENSEWNTIYLENLDNVQGYSIIDKQIFNCLGTKYNSNINFVGFNFPYFALVTKDNETIRILEDITGINAYEVPERKKVRISIAHDRGFISVKADEEMTCIPLAALHAFKPVAGSYEEMHNLIVAKDKELRIKLVYPYFKQGLMLSVFGLLGFAAFYNLYLKKRS